METFYNQEILANLSFIMNFTINERQSGACLSSHLSS